MAKQPPRSRGGISLNRAKQVIVEEARDPFPLGRMPSTKLAPKKRKPRRR